MWGIEPKRPIGFRNAGTATAEAEEKGTTDGSQQTAATVLLESCVNATDTSGPQETLDDPQLNIVAECRRRIDELEEAERKLQTELARIAEARKAAQVAIEEANAAYLAAHSLPSTLDVQASRAQQSVNQLRAETQAFVRANAPASASIERWLESLKADLHETRVNQSRALVIGTTASQRDAFGRRVQLLQTYINGVDALRFECVTNEDVIARITPFVEALSAL